MVMLMIKFGAYKAACCWVCAPSFRADNKTYDERDDLGDEREKKAKNQVSEPLLALLPSFVLFSSVFSLPLPLPKKKKALSSLYRTKGRKRERERCRYHRKRLGHR